MSSIQPESLSELFCICETIEYGCLMVTACAEIWVVGHILYWPPNADFDRSKIVPPQSDWIPTMCRVLKSSIATFEEALTLEKQYSKHRDSSSFRASEAEKQLKRKHPVNSNEQIRSNLIDATSMVGQIDKKQGSAETKPKPVATVPKKRINVLSKSKNIDSVNDTKRPRYENYLKSGKRNVQVHVHVEKKNKPPPPLMKLKKAGVSATITKAQFLKQNSNNQSEFQKVATTGDAPIVQNNLYDGVEDFLDNENAIFPRKVGINDKQLNSTANVANTFGLAAHRDMLELHNNENVPVGIVDKMKHSIAAEGRHTKTRVNVIEDVMIRPATVDPSTHDGNNALSDNIGNTILREVKNLFKESEEKRIRFEARMQNQWEMFTKKMILAQGQNDGEAEPIDENDDFEDLDAGFPLTYPPAQVEQLDWDVQSDLAFKRRMKNRLDQLGGKDEKASIRAKMKFLIADEVLEHFTWRGTGEKQAFNKLVYLNNLIFRSVRFHFPKYNFIAFKTYMVQWIKHARSRQRTVVYQYPNRNQQQENLEDDDDQFE